MIVRLLLAASLVGAAGDAWAQARATDPDDSQEIIVTGERVPRALRETPSSVVVVTQQDIEASGADRVDQILALVPNVQFGSGTEGPAIRGQDSTGVLRELFAFLGGTRPRATLTVDGRAVTYNEYVLGAASVWDVGRVEIFRSPQTTTQGRNSIAGAIFVNTNAPAFEWEGRARAIVGDFGTRQASAVVSGPIVADQVAVRVSGDIKLGRMASDMADGIPGADIDRDDHGVARVKLLAEPRALPGLRVEASYAHLRSQAPQFEAARAPFRERRFPVPERTNGVLRTQVDSVTALISYALTPALTSRTTFSYGDALVQRFGLPGLGRTRVNSADVSAESSLSWQPDDAFRLIGGVHYLTLDQDQFIDITGLNIGSGGFDDRQRSLGLFGEATWRPAPRVALTAGLRHQRDRQDREGQVGPVGPGISVDYDGRFDAWLPKVSVAYDLADKATIGLLVQRAFNPGGTTVNLATRRQDNFEAERLWNYEASRAPRSWAGAGRWRPTCSTTISRMRSGHRRSSSSRRTASPSEPPRSPMRRPRNRSGWRSSSAGGRAPGWRCDSASACCERISGARSLSRTRYGTRNSSDRPISAPPRRSIGARSTICACPRSFARIAAISATTPTRLRSAFGDRRWSMLAPHIRSAVRCCLAMCGMRSTAFI